jgi:hypothetical protein
MLRALHSTAVVARRFIVRKDGTLFCKFVATKFIVVNAAFGRAQHFQYFRAAKCIYGATLLWSGFELAYGVS